MSSQLGTRSSLDYQSVVDFFQENIKGLIAILVVIAIGILVAVGYRSYQKEVHLKERDFLYAFEAKSLSEFKAGKLDAAGLQKEWDSVQKNVSKSSPERMLTILRMAALMQEKNFGGEALNLLNPIIGDLKSLGSEVDFLGHLLVASLQEDKGLLDESIATLEKLLQQKNSYLEAKIYFDLGRLYKKKNQLDKARSNFNYVIEHFAASSYVALAKIYLHQLK